MMKYIILTRLDLFDDLIGLDKLARKQMENNSSIRYTRYIPYYTTLYNTILTKVLV
jgi:hypothetical protein